MNSIPAWDLCGAIKWICLVSIRFNLSLISDHVFNQPLSQIMLSWFMLMLLILLYILSSPISVFLSFLSGSFDAYNRSLKSNEILVICFHNDAIWTMLWPYLARLFWLDYSVRLFNSIVLIGRGMWSVIPGMHGF